MKIQKSGPGIGFMDGRYVNVTGDDMTGSLQWSLGAAGTSVIRDITDSASTDSGFLMNGGGSLTGGMFTEVTGNILSYGINTPQMTTRNTARSSGIFRLDMRGTAEDPSLGAHDCFVVLGYGTGAGASEALKIVIDMNSGDTDLAPETGNTIIGTRGALATGATSGFLHIPTCAGTPTGVPTAYTGKVPLVYNTSQNKLMVYNGAWISVGTTT